MDIGRFQLILEDGTEENPVLMVLMDLGLLMLMQVKTELKSEKILMLQ